jgi:hypothetical protein
MFKLIQKFFWKKVKKTWFGLDNNLCIWTQISSYCNLVNKWFSHLEISTKIRKFQNPRRNLVRGMLIQTDSDGFGYMFDIFSRKIQIYSGKFLTKSPKLWNLSIRVDRFWNTQKSLIPIWKTMAYIIKTTLILRLFEILWSTTRVFEKMESTLVKPYQVQESWNFGSPSL